MVETTSNLNLKQPRVVTGETEQDSAIINTEVWGPSPEYKEKPLEGHTVKFHPRAAEKGGLILPDEGGQGPKTFKNMMGQIGGKFITGQFKELFRLSTPAETHAPYSYLQTAANDTALCGTHLRNAAAESDPIKRMKWICAFYIGGLARAPTMVTARMPLNPILGETLQLEGPNGEKFFAEQTCHHPPILNFLLETEDYSYSGWYENKAWLSGMDSVTGHRSGKIVFNFADGGLYSVVDGNQTIHGFTGGKDIVTNFVETFTITDHINNMVATLTMNPAPEKKGGFMSGVKSLFGGKKATGTEQRIDFCKIQISQSKGTGSKKTLESVSQGEGSFMSHCQFNDDQQVYWTIDDQTIAWRRVEEGLLLSDSYHRVDLQCLLKEEMVESEVAKMELENVQRHDKKCRDDCTKKRGK